MSEPKNELEQIESLESQVSALVSRLDEACGRVAREMSDNDADWIEETEDAIERLADATEVAPDTELGSEAIVQPDDQPVSESGQEPDSEADADGESTPEPGGHLADEADEGDAVGAGSVADAVAEPEMISQIAADEEVAHAEPVARDELGAGEDPGAESGDLASAVDEALALLTADEASEQVGPEAFDDAVDAQPDGAIAEPTGDPQTAVDEDEPGWDSPRAPEPAPLDASYAPGPGAIDPESGASVLDAAPDDAETEAEVAASADQPGADPGSDPQPENDAVGGNSDQDEFATAMASVLSDLGLDEDLPQDYSDLPEGTVEGYVEPEAEVSEVAPDENLDDDPEGGEDDGPDLGPAESAAAMGPDELDAELAKLAEDLIEKTPEAPPPDEAVVGAGAPEVGAESPASEEPARTPEPEKAPRSAGGKTKAKAKAKAKSKATPSKSGAGSGVWAKVRPPLVAVLGLVAPWLAKGLLSAAKPLEAKPPVWRDTIGLIAVYSVFLATSVLIWAAFFRPDEIPVVIVKPPELAAPEEADPGPTAVPTEGAP